jgi:serine/threonine-protein kinase RsbW
VAAEVVTRLGGDHEAVAVARLGVSELLSNVVKHVADPRCLLVIAGEGSDFRITVRDRSTAAPAVTRPAWDSDSGRGLWLLREMARDLGYTCFPGGKAVWFRCPLRSLSEVAVR